MSHDVTIKRGGAKHGTLKVSKGSIVWVPKDYTHGYKMGWRKFAELMEDNGTKEG
jgi:hypothetical protein